MYFKNTIISQASIGAIELLDYICFSILFERKEGKDHQVCLIKIAVGEFKTIHTNHKYLKSFNFYLIYLNIPTNIMGFQLISYHNITNIKDT